MNIFTFIDPIAKWLGDWSISINIWSIILRMAIAIILGAVIGCERSSKRHSAGLRTFILVTLVSTMAMILDMSLIQSEKMSIYLFSAAAIIGTVMVSGNAILFSSKKQIKGLTTSAGLWMCGILGLVIGAGFYLTAIIVCFILICILFVLPRLEKFMKDKSNHFEIHLELKDRLNLQDFVFTLRKLGIQVDEIEINSAYIGSGLSVYTISLTDRSKQYKKHSDIIHALQTLKYVHYIEEIK